MGIRTTVYKIIPYKLLRRLERKAKSEDRKSLIQKIRLERFVKRVDFSALNVQSMPVCTINKGTWDYPLFHIGFLENMFAGIVYCLADGYVPQVKYKNSKGELLWEQLLRQPYSDCVLKKPTKECEEVFPSFHLPVFPTTKDVKIYGKLFKAFFTPNETAEQYFKNEEYLIKSKRVVGVLCRGTDYVANKPKWHPVQPKVEDVINEVKIKMAEYNCEYVYLATDEEKIKAQFDQAFPDKVITNKRKYYDEFYKLKESGKEDTRISWVHFDRENDNYYKSREYISSLNILSKCNLLIAGNCGGSRAAIYLNDNKYEYVKLFNLGVY